MLKNILGTIGTKVLTALMTIVVVVLNARILGAEGIGTIGIIILDITIIQLFTNFVGGGALIYMTPRHGVFRLIFPSYIWALLVGAITALVLEWIGMVFPGLETIPAGYFWTVLILGLLFSLSSVNLILLLGLEKVRLFNCINIVQIILLVLILLLCYFWVGLHTVQAYLYALFISNAAAFMLGLVCLLPEMKPAPLKDMSVLVKEILRFGAYVQFANIFQQLNYRLSYFIVDVFAGRASVGVLNVGVQVSEGFWLISRSIALVQFTRISNENDTDYAIRITLALAKMTWLITLAAIILLLLIPSAVFAFIFGPEFSAIRPVILSLAAGIVVLSISMILSQFFSGINKPIHNTISSAIGLAFTLGAGLLLIPLLGVVGAGITATLSYLASTLYQMIVFIRSTKVPWKSLMVTSSDVRLLKSTVRSALSGGKA